MPPGNPVRLLKLADREFRQLTGKPATPEPRRKFKPVRLNPTRFDSAWDRKRGAAVRLMAVVLREDDAGLERRVCENERSVKVYADAADWLQRESAYLRKMARLLETAGTRVSSVLGRCGRQDARDHNQSPCATREPNSDLSGRRSHSAVLGSIRSTEKVLRHLGHGVAVISQPLSELERIWEIARAE